ncbi:hypothetical protein FA15DRAFT_710815 [Coprinopsis marcescibilis]|uniref:Uncharacterized protein n=1 Tax=Coprinopsis marcescibilis TaxID=230819 RepID=A0A5C3KBV1_COPMA|nr:hypothetical protein FA15DRAFT_710815 [Coprinopsis marcescibilis]
MAAPATAALPSGFNLDELVQRVAIHMKNLHQSSSGWSGGVATQPGLSSAGLFSPTTSIVGLGDPRLGWDLHCDPCHAMVPSPTPSISPDSTDSESIWDNLETLHLDVDNHNQLSNKDAEGELDITNTDFAMADAIASTSTSGSSVTVVVGLAEGSHTGSADIIVA